ncbi:hypothetical protein GWI33_006410 [Rhynchophorus ferrugineus]|uniref:Uncharacterized protein n=1 Tax=Rhynchophorus ferrugineus TaxID=354439 RepID=A0A834MDT4_RHYFE|nr:hypothetical protein GWI33_006410 [Rhynchophorus ferrugineus]
MSGNENKPDNLSIHFGTFKVKSNLGPSPINSCEVVEVAAVGDGIGAGTRPKDGRCCTGWTFFGIDSGLS